eukprot:1142352-Pelagomonas_calceolata.AAC.3
MAAMNTTPVNAMSNAMKDPVEQVEEQGQQGTLLRDGLQAVLQVRIHAFQANVLISFCVPALILELWSNSGNWVATSMDLACLKENAPGGASMLFRQSPGPGTDPRLICAVQGMSKEGIRRGERVQEHVLRKVGGARGEFHSCVPDAFAHCQAFNCKSCAGFELIIVCIAHTCQGVDLPF